MNFLLSAGDCPRLVENTENRSVSNLDRKYTGYSATSDTLFSQILIFFQLTLMYTVEIFLKKGLLTL